MKMRSECMRLSDIVSMGIDYILVGIVALLFVGTVFSMWYFLWFKKKRAGEKLDKRKILLYNDNRDIARTGSPRPTDEF